MRNSLLIVALFFSLFGFTQEKITDLNLGYSVNAYKGDFSGYSKARNAFHLSVILNREKRVSGELNFRVGGLAAETIHYNEPIATFVKTNYFSLNYGLNIRAVSIKKHTTIHLVPGLGIIRFTPKDFAGNSLADLSSTRSSGEEFSNVALILPIKLQVRHRFSHRMGATLEAGFLNTRTDYLDNISQLSDPARMDNVLFLNFGLSFLLKDRSAQNSSTLVKESKPGL